MKKVNYSKELLEPIVQKVFTYSDVCRELGLKPYSGNIQTVHQKIDEFNIDTSHFNRQKSSIHKDPPKQGAKVTLEDVFSGKYLYKNSDSLRRRFIKEGYKECKCEICGNSEWLGKPINLQLHHINGDHFDNHLDNLQILCPNCHSQTDTYGSKNLKY